MNDKLRLRENLEKWQKRQEAILRVSMKKKSLIPAFAFLHEFNAQV